MKKCIATFLCFFAVCIHFGIELYPSGMLFAKKYVSEIDLQKVLQSKPIAKYMSHLSIDEKDEIVALLTTLTQTKN